MTCILDSLFLGCRTECQTMARKKKMRLIIPLNEDIVKILHEYLKYRQGTMEDWLFISTYGDQLTRSSCCHALWDYCHICGIERTGVHRFRHTFAKKWVTMGGSVVTLQKILGHSSLDITENYLNILTTDLKKDMMKSTFSIHSETDSILYLIPLCHVYAIALFFGLLGKPYCVSRKI